MAFSPKSFNQIVADMAAKLSAETPINDFTPGSVALTLLEASAQEDFQQYIQMIEIIKSYNLDTTEGTDLDDRAFEFSLTRLAAKPHSGFISVIDSSFEKISTKLYAGLPGPTAGSNILNVDDASDFPSTGSVYIGRGTSNSEGPIAYTAAPIDNTSSWEITLDTNLLNDHGTDETVILAQKGERTVSAGTEVRIPENDYSEEILFELNQAVTLLDGENRINNVLVTALEPGGSNVPKGTIREFVSAPFTGAVVINDSPFVNGRDEETDDELRDRIRDTIQSLSRGTRQSIQSGILGIIDTNTNSSITSVNVIPPVVLADGPTSVFIDNGRGLEPELDPLGFETLISSATGGEKFFQTSQFPLIKANLISQLAEPFNLVGGETIILRVGFTEETFTFLSSDFVDVGNAEATEVAEAINNRATLFEARTITEDNEVKVLLLPKASQNENIKLNPLSTANTVLNFATREVYTLKLYKNDKLLTKDGETASVVSGPQPFNLSANEDTSTADAVFTSGSKLVTISASQDLRNLVHPGDYVKSSLDTDIYFAKVRSILDSDKLILEEEYRAGTETVGTPKLVVWHSPRLEVSSNGDLFETEVISFSKNDFSDPTNAQASEVLTRLQKELNLSKSELTVNNSRIQFTSNLENSANSKIRIVGGQAALSMGFSGFYGLTGTIDVNANDRLVTGTGTLFTSELQEGQWIKVTSDDNGAWVKVESIFSDTLLYLAEDYRGLTTSSAAATAMTLGEEVVGKDKDYTLNKSNGQIELVEPLVAGDNLTVGSINTRAFSDSGAGSFDFTSLGASSNLIIEVSGGISAIVDVGNNTTFDSLTSADLENYEVELVQGQYIKCISGQNAGEVSTIASYTPSTGAITLTTPLTYEISINDVFAIYQVIELTHSNFADIANVTAEEIATEINKSLKGATAIVQSDGTVRIQSNKFEDDTLQILEGSANTILSFDQEIKESQEANLAYVESENTDRQGLANYLGFTLSPNQNIVTVFDDDNANKTFTSTMRIEGTVTGGAINSIICSGLIPKYTKTDYFKDFWVYWKAGAANEGTLQVVLGYDEVTGTISTEDVYPNGTPSAAPNNGDIIQLVPRTAENFVTLMNDLNTTTISTVADIEAILSSADKVQIATKTPGTSGKVLVSGGTANSIGIPVTGPVLGNILTPGVNEVQRIDFASTPTTGEIRLIFEGQTTAASAIQVTDAVNEVQRITFSSVPDAGAFQLEFDGQFTAPIPYNATLANIQAFLTSLSNIDSVVVTGSFAAGLDIEFQGTQAGTNVSQLSLASNTLTLAAVPVTVLIATNTEGSGPIVFTATEVQTALEGLSNVDPGDVVVTGDTSIGFEITFGGQYEFTNVAGITISTDTTDGSPAASTAVIGSPVVYIINEISTNSIAGLSKGMPVLVSYNDGSPQSYEAFISDIQGTTSPYSIFLQDITGADIDVSNLTSVNQAAISDLNGLNLNTTQVEGIDGYKYYTGLIQLAQWTIDGLDIDQSNYPGIGAAGTQFEVRTPAAVKLQLSVNVTPIEGVSLSSISNSVSSKILEYVNSRKVGEDVVLSEITAAAQEVFGVYDIEILSHTSNIVIADGELVKLNSNDLTIG